VQDQNKIETQKNKIYDFWHLEVWAICFIIWLINCKFARLVKIQE